MNSKTFNILKNESIVINEIHYSPPNFLRMGMYLELSRPRGDTTRWVKVIKRLNLLNKHYPLHVSSCKNVDFQRNMVTNKSFETKIYDITRNTLIEEDVVFFGGYASSLYSFYMPDNLKKKLNNNPDFDVLSETPKQVSKKLVERLMKLGITNLTVIKKDAIGDFLPEHYQVKIDDDTIVFIYKPLACYSYNTIKLNKKIIRVATIDTMLSFYLAFLYSGKNYYDTHRILCMANFLFNVEQENRLKQDGLLRRFSISCYGHQETLLEIREKRASKYLELKDKFGTKEYEEFFFKYRPNELSSQGKIRKKYKNTTIKNKKQKTYKKSLNGSNGSNVQTFKRLKNRK